MPWPIGPSSTESVYGEFTTGFVAVFEGVFESVVTARCARKRVKTVFRFDTPYGGRDDCHPLIHPS